MCAAMSLGTFGFILAEGLSLADAIYFTVVTIATVGRVVPQDKRA
nr:ion channel [Desulfuromonas sp.]